MDELAGLFRALSDATRLRIIKLLQHGELCVCHLVAASGMVQSKISFHLRVLKAAGLVKDRKEGKWIYYHLDESDLFKRFLFLSVNECVSEDLVAEDRGRLEAFLLKAARADRSKPTCCRETGGICRGGAEGN